MTKLPSQIPDFSPESITRGWKCAKSRHTCELVVSHPPTRVAGHFGASHFSAVVEIDSFFVEDLIAPIHFDVATRFAYSSTMGNEVPDTVWNDILFTWVKHFGLPGQITSDSGGEFSAKWFAD